MSDLNAKIIKTLGAPFFASLVASGIELSEDMFVTALAMSDVKYDSKQALITLQKLFPRKHETSSGGGNVFYINSSTPTTIVLGSFTGNVTYGASASSRSDKPSKSRSSSNGDWKFEGDRVFLNQEWHKLVKDTNISIAFKEGFCIIKTNNNDIKRAVGYYSKSNSDVPGFTRFHNTTEAPTLKYGKGPEGYYYVKNNLVSLFSWLKPTNTNSDSEQKTITNENNSSDQNTTKQKEIEINVEDMNF